VRASGAGGDGSEPELELVDDAPVGTREAKRSIELVEEGVGGLPADHDHRA
jgi:hypothetical protein